MEKFFFIHYSFYERKKEIHDHYLILHRIQLRQNVFWARLQLWYCGLIYGRWLWMALNCIPSHENWNEMWCCWCIVGQNYSTLPRSKLKVFPFNTIAVSRFWKCVCNRMYKYILEVCTHWDFLILVSLFHTTSRHVMMISPH